MRSFWRKKFLVVSVFFLLSSISFISNGVSEEPQKEPFKTLVFVDGYWADSRNNYRGQQRPYFTQASENNEMRLNLSAVGFGYDDGLLRGRLVGQYGDSVDINYFAEPENDWKYLQESYMGFYVDEDTSFDIGTFLAHIGAEGWMSKDNLNYTRSYIAEFSPYYETGGRLSHTFNDHWSGQFLVLNGWQNTSEGRHPAFGTQVAWNADQLTISSNTFFGEENYGSRAFHNLIVSKKLESGTVLTGSVDVGHQGDSSSSNGTWWGYALMGRTPLTETLSLSGRVESYQDPDQVIVSSSSGEPFRAYGLSTGMDIDLGHGFFLRGEVKRVFSDNHIFVDDESAKKSDMLYVLSVSFLDEHTF
jgi:hypothetical protein